MRKNFYRRLAVSNIKKNGKIYLPFILSSIMCVAMYYIIHSLSLNPGFQKMMGARTLNEILGFATVVTVVFVVLFLLYANSFLMKRRKKEFGLCHILGMEKKHLSLTLFWESLMVLGMSLVLGIAVGIILDKLLYMVLIKMMGFSVPLGFYISRAVVMHTTTLFLGIFVLIYLYNVTQIHVANPVELLRAGEVGEKEPRTKWIMAILGVICMGVGYYLAIVTKDPLSALTTFFVAVLLVIAGTYLLFTSGSIALLKLLRKNKKYYYKTNHFVSISGMLYRMKQNAVGLAHICILSTMMLVTVSATTALMVGFEDLENERYPMDYNFYALSPTDEGVEAVNQLMEDVQKSLKVTKQNSYRYMSVTLFKDGDDYRAREAALDGAINTNNIRICVFIPVEDYNCIAKKKVDLKAGEVLVAGNRQAYEEDSITLMSNTLRVKGKPEDVITNGMVASNVADSLYIVVEKSMMDTLYEAQKKVYGENASDIKYYYGLDVEGTDKDKIETYNAITLTDEFADVTGVNDLYCECRANERASGLALFGGLFFVGIFLGTLFLLITVLIIYYKQISEGFDDQRRFSIMRQVGMTDKEVSSSIRSQVLTVFFLPLVVAGIHLCVAFPLVSKLLALFQMKNVMLYGICMLICYLVFALFYIVIYCLTAKAYRDIVKK